MLATLAHHLQKPSCRCVVEPLTWDPSTWLLLSQNRQPVQAAAGDSGIIITRVTSTAEKEYCGIGPLGDSLCPMVSPFSN